ncbi:hypothetical protein ILYODFUR_025348 [Ilyodon furcidens]|uniref:Uncharacterized protein n=1 Tax=Ilyodon furcidens TaxID=33524 RepID=A0ABV0SSA2_9TELE
MLLVNDEPLFIDYLLVSDQSALFILTLLAGISRCNLGTVARWTEEEEEMLNFLVEPLCLSSHQPGRVFQLQE